MKANQLQLWFRRFFFIACCFAASIAAAGDESNDVPEEAAPLDHKPHCAVLDPNSPIYQNLRKTASYIRRGNLEKVTRAVKNGLPVNAYFEDDFYIAGQTFRARLSLLDIAVMFEKHDIVDMLLKQGANPEGCGTYQLDPMFMAIFNRDFKSLDRLVEAGAKPDTIIGPASERQTALHFLASSPHGCSSEPVNRDILGSMQKLLTRGANVNATNAKGETPLIQSVRSCKYNPAYPLTSLLLVTHGADPYVRGVTGNIIHRMLSHGYLSRNDDLWQLFTEYASAGGHTMMQAAMEIPDLQERLAAIQESITHSQGVFSWLWQRMKFTTGTLRDHLEEITAIINDERVRKNDPEQVKPLVSCEQEVNCFTPLHFAGTHFLTPEALQRLKQLGSDFSQRSYEGKTVLHYAVQNNQYENLHLLAPYSVDPMQRSREGMNSFDFAMLYTPEKDRHDVFYSLCNLTGNSDMSGQLAEQCLSYFDLFNASCSQPMAAENVTLSANPELEQRYLSSFAMKGCMKQSKQSLSSQQKVQILTETLDTTYDRINARDKTWVVPELVRRNEMLDYPELKNYLIQQYPGQAEHLKDKLNPITQAMMANIAAIGMANPSFEFMPENQLVASGRRPTESMTHTFLDLNARSAWASPSHLKLQEIQSFAQLKHFLSGAQESEKSVIHTYLIQRNEPALFMYLLSMGIPIEQQPSCDLPDDQSYLCRDPLSVILENRDNVAFWNLLMLYGYYDFSHIQAFNQYKDLSLYLAVHSNNPYMVEQLLSKGSNPNAFLPQEHYGLALSFLLDDEAKADFSLPSCGLLSDALHMEQNQTVARMSRLLLLYGASVDPVIPHGCSLLPEQQGQPLSWVNRIQDRELAMALNYFDPANIRYRAAEGLPATAEWHSDYQTAVNVLNSASRIHTLIMHNDALSPLCTCSGLQRLNLPIGPTKKDEPEETFTPYCQELISALPESVQQTICSPAAFQ